MRRRFDHQRVAIGQRQNRLCRGVVRHGEFVILQYRRGQQAGLAAASERLQDRVAIAQRIEPELRLLDHGADLGGKNFQAPCPALPRWAQRAVVAIGRHLIAEKEHQPAAASEIGVEHTGLAGGELGHVAEKHAVVAAEVSI